MIKIIVSAIIIGQAMGGQQCKELTLETHKKSSAYGIYELVLKKNHEYAVVSKSVSKTSVKAPELQQQLQKRKKLQLANLVNLCAYEMIETGTFIDIKLYYQYIPLTLAQRVQSWKALKKNPSQAEIGNLLLGIQSVLRQLYVLEIGHRCVNLETILCWQSLYKLTDISMLTFLTGYDFERQGDTQQFLSSHLLNYLYYQGTEPKYTLEDDLFSLAMIVIAVVLGNKPEQLYFMDSWNSKKVNVKKLQDGRQKLKSLYRPWIQQKVGEMIEAGLSVSQETPKKNNKTSRKDTYSV